MSDAPFILAVTYNTSKPSRAGQAYDVTISEGAEFYDPRAGGGCLKLVSDWNNIQTYMGRYASREDAEQDAQAMLESVKIYRITNVDTGEMHYQAGRRPSPSPMNAVAPVAIRLQK